MAFFYALKRQLRAGQLDSIQLAKPTIVKLSELVQNIDTKETSEVNIEINNAQSFISSFIAVCWKKVRINFYPTR